ncbi:ferrous iron transport protein A [Caminicella sporogenes DSM 14501]|uniref:Ferrous iron transport protein A n=1 Tax=Caminicella sporogenes DSM 14501 TaxID=1121266 RepID=A0A1M6PF05_9FIRM|nr:FeoA family protein [Caminicella sporogenes]RKD21424.1 iron transporter FeoA [Caminicella sporogenes]SHK06497.1 ferrous iron transport protein A [Caminicella sporogenes DSM 14501]
MQNTLKDLKPGESGIVAMVKGKGAVKRRLMDMGIVKGAEVIVEKIAPLGDPIEVKIKGYSLTLRKKDAENIMIE